MWHRDFCRYVDTAKYREFAARLREQGIFMTGNTVLHNLSCTEHTAADVQDTVDAVGTVRRVQQRGSALYVSAKVRLDRILPVAVSRTKILSIGALSSARGVLLLKL